MQLQKWPKILTYFLDWRRDKSLLLPWGRLKLKSWRKSGNVLSIFPCNSWDYWKKFLFHGPRKEIRNQKDTSFYHATYSELGNTTYMQFLSDQENIHTKGDVNRYSSEVSKCMIPIPTCDNSALTFCLMPILIFSAKFQSPYYFNRLMFLKC